VQHINYANLRAPGAVTAVPERTLVSATPVARDAVRLSRRDARDLARSRAVGEFEARPGRESVLGVNAGKPAAVPPVHVDTRPVVARMTPPAPGPRVQPAQDGPEIRSTLPVRSPISAPAISAGPARFVPRPPQRGTNPTSVIAVPQAPHPPCAADIEARMTRPAIRQVPRPPAAGSSNEGRVNPSKPTSVTGNTASPDDVHHYRATPGIREIPRPPADGAIAQRGDTGKSNANPPQPRIQRQGATPDVRRPMGPVSSPRSIGPDERTPRVAPSGAAPARVETPRSYGDTPRVNTPAASPRTVDAAPRGPVAAPSSPAPQGGGTPRAPRFR
jgi:hypothetical protein